MDIFRSFLNRIERGELDPGDDYTERVRRFFNEVITNIDLGFLTEKQAAILACYHFKRRGIIVDIPDKE